MLKEMRNGYKDLFEIVVGMRQWEIKGKEITFYHDLHVS